MSSLTTQIVYSLIYLIIPCLFYKQVGEIFEKVLKNYEKSNLDFLNVVWSFLRLNLKLAGGYSLVTA